MKDVICDNCGDTQGTDIVNDREDFWGVISLLCHECSLTHRLLIHDRNDGVKQDDLKCTDINRIAG